MMSMMKNFLRWLTPHGLIQMRCRAGMERDQLAVEHSQAAHHAERHARMAAIATSSASARFLAGDDCEAVIRYLVGRGLNEHHVREGSVPISSLEFIRDQATSKLDASKPLRALHVGNFVGVSLAYLTATLVGRHPESLVVSVDPNLTHRGIRNPQSHVLALLSACGLQTHSLVLAGYSGKKSISNDATMFEGYDPAAEYANEAAGEETLRNLTHLCPASFDLIFLDGNHEAAYLLNEIRQLLPLLRVGGFVVLDDVDAAWAEIREVFQNISSYGLEPVQANGRVGIAQLKPGTNRAA